jgi:hypothetical protein
MNGVAGFPSLQLADFRKVRKIDGLICRRLRLSVYHAGAM